MELTIDAHRTVASCMLLLQPLRCCCIECVIHHEQHVHEEQQYIYVAQTSNNRVIMACELYCCLLPQCEALRICHSGFSDRNTTVHICDAADLFFTLRHS